MKRFAAVAAALLLALSLPTDAKGQTRVQVGPRIGVDAGDLEEPFIGADVRIGWANSPLKINPTFDYYLVDGPSTYWALSTNALYQFGVDNQAFTPYSGAGLGIYRSSPDGANGSTNVGLNALFGAEFHVGPVQPFVEAQYSPVFSDGDTSSLFTVKGGLLFSL